MQNTYFKRPIQRICNLKRPIIIICFFLTFIIKSEKIKKQQKDIFIEYIGRFKLITTNIKYVVIKILQARMD